MIKVWHCPDELFGSVGRTGTVRILENFHSFKLVAEVFSDDMNVAYERTNTIHGAWWESAVVKFLGSATHGRRGCRSTSIGDVLELEDGTLQIVASDGFTQVDSTVIANAVHSMLRRPNGGDYVWAIRMVKAVSRPLKGLKEAKDYVDRLIGRT